MSDLIRWTPEQRAAVEANMRRVGDALRFASDQARLSIEKAGPKMRAALERIGR